MSVLVVLVVELVVAVHALLVRTVLAPRARQGPGQQRVGPSRRRGRGPAPPTRAAARASPRGRRCPRRWRRRQCGSTVRAVVRSTAPRVAKATSTRHVSDPPRGRHALGLPRQAKRRRNVTARGACGEQPGQGRPRPPPTTGSVRSARSRHSLLGSWIGGQPSDLRSRRRTPRRPRAHDLPDWSAAHGVPQLGGDEVTSPPYPDLPVIMCAPAGTIRTGRPGTAGPRRRSLVRGPSCPSVLSGVLTQPRYPSSGHSSVAGSNRPSVSVSAERPFGRLGSPNCDPRYG